MKDIYNENHKTLKKKLEEDIRRLKDILCVWISELIL
jgi:hypothetical protein